MFRKVFLNEHAYLELYLLDTILDSGEKNPPRPLVLVLPGGGYQCTSKRVSQPIALKMNSFYKHSAVLHYTNLKQNLNLQLADLIFEVKQSLEQIYKYAEEYSIDLTKIFVIGFSAGGHLAAVLNNLLPEKFKAVLLGYPAVGFSLGYGTWPGAEAVANNPQDRAMLNLFMQDPIQEIGVYNKPTFIFTASDDDVVPVQNVIAYAERLLEFNCKLELHVYVHGGHGFSLADPSSSTAPDQINPRVSTWLDLANSWMDALE